MKKTAVDILLLEPEYFAVLVDVKQCLEEWSYERRTPLPGAVEAAVTRLRGM